MDDPVVAGIGDPGRVGIRASGRTGITDPGSRQKRFQHSRQIQRVGRRRPFVGDRFYIFTLARLASAQSMKLGRSGPKTHETRTIRLLVSLQSAPFPFPLRFAINTDRPRLVFFRIGLALLPIENVIRADMNEPRLLSPTNFRKNARCFPVNRERFLRFRLAPIDIRLRRRVDQRIELKLAQRRSYLLRRAEIELRVIKSDNVERARVFPRPRLRPVARLRRRLPTRFIAFSYAGNPKSQTPNPRANLKPQRPKES